MSGIGTPAIVSPSATQYQNGSSVANPVGTQVNWNDLGIQRATSLANPLPVRMSNGANYVDLPVEGDVNSNNFRGFVAFAKTTGNVAKQLVVDSNQSLNVNVADMNGIATSMGNGTTDTGTQRVTISSDSTGSIIAVGNVASAATDSGNPVKVGGIFKTTQPTVTDGQRVDAQFSSRGALRVVAGTETFIVGGNGNFDSASPNAGFGVGFVASLAIPSAVGADGRLVKPWADRVGRLVITQRAATSTITQVGDSATSITLLALNTSRVGATISNDSTAILYLKLGATASTSSYTVKLTQDAHYEVPFGYTGIIDGIWASDAGGNALVDEIT